MSGVLSPSSSCSGVVDRWQHPLSGGAATPWRVEVLDIYRGNARTPVTLQASRTDGKEILAESMCWCVFCFPEGGWVVCRMEASFCAHSLTDATKLRLSE